MLSHDSAKIDLPPQLSLCIPTYNRAVLLQEALEAIAGQSDAALFAAVEVIVSDNASPDATADVVHSIAERYSYLKVNYVRQPENVGVNQNIYDVIQRATGEFVWILSDDDVLLPGALNQFFALRQAYPEHDAFCLNMRTFLSNPQEESRPVLALAQDRLLSDQNAALQLFGTWITFISVVVFRKSALARTDYDQRIDTWLGYCYQFLDTLTQGAVVLCQPYLAVRDNYRGGYNFFEVFVTRFRDLLIYAEEIGYSRQVTRQVFRQHLRNFLFSFVLGCKRRQARGKPLLDYRDGVQRMLKAYGPDSFLIFVMLPLLATPPVVVRAAYASCQFLGKTTRILRKIIRKR